MKTKFERTTEITPAFDWRSQGHGIRGCDLIMRLKGKTGIVYFSLSTNWQLPRVTSDEVKEAIGRIQTNRPFDELDYYITRLLPSPIELGYHSPVPLKEGQEYSRLNCEHFPGRTPCYCESGCLAAVPVFKILVEEGSEAVWTFLENYYKKTFGEIEGDI